MTMHVHQFCGSVYTSEIDTLGTCACVCHTVYMPHKVRWSIYCEVRSIILGNLFNLCHSVSGKGQQGAQQSRSWKGCACVCVHVSMHSLVGTCYILPHRLCVCGDL